MVHAALLEELHLIAHEFRRIWNPAHHTKLIDQDRHVVLRLEIVDDREITVQPFPVECIGLAIPVEIERAWIGICRGRLLMGIVLLRFVLVNHIDDARIVHRFQPGQPAHRAPTHAADQDRGRHVHFANSFYNARIKAIPVVDAVRVFSIKLRGLINSENHIIGVRLAHQVVTHHDRVVAIAFCCVAPHLGPGILRGLVAPDRLDQQFRIEPIPRSVTIESKVTASRPGAKSDHHEQVGFRRHGDHAIQIGLRLFIQHIGRSLGEYPRM